MRKKSLLVSCFLFLTTIFFLLSCVASAQTFSTPSFTAPEMPPVKNATPAEAGPELWYLTRGGAKLDQGWGVDTDSEGNIYFATFQQAEKEPFADIVLYKFSPGGKEIWHARWGGKNMEKAFIVTVKGNTVYVGGLTYISAVSLTEADMAVLAFNAQDGSLAWNFTWGQGFGYEEVDGLVVEDDAIYLSGWTTGKTTGNDVAVLKLDLKGKLIWAKSWGGKNWDEGDGQMVVDGDTIYVAGRYNGTNIILGGEGLIVRFSKQSGEYISHTTWGGPLGTDALGMTSDGTFLYAVGLTVDKGNGGQIFLRKYDKSLNLIWEELWGGKGSESARAVAVGPLGDIYLAGSSDSFSDGGGLDVAFLRYTPDGVLVWAKTWGGRLNDGASGLAIYGNRAYIAGNTKSYGNGQDDALLISADTETGQFPSIPNQ
jgi:PQQ-like domain